MDVAALKPGDQVTWLHDQRGGYGYVQPVPVTVKKVGKKKVQVEAPLKIGGTKLVWVTPERLRKRE